LAHPARLERPACGFEGKAPGFHKLGLTGDGTVMKVTVSYPRDAVHQYLPYAAICNPGLASRAATRR